MQGPFMVSIFRRPTGRFKVYITGHADSHTLDWRGANYVHTPVTGQPRLGFMTFEEAEKFAQALERDEGRFHTECSRARAITGSWLPEEWRASRCTDCRQPHIGSLPYCNVCWSEKIKRSRASSI